MHEFPFMRNCSFIAHSRRLLAALFFVLCLCYPAAAKTTCQSYPSPDRRYCVTVQQIEAPGAVIPESIITIHDRSGKLLARQSYTSADHEHGFAIQQIQWSKDSSYCVWNLTSSGGHSPWHFPTDCFAARCHSILHIDAQTKKSLSASHFTLTATHQLQTQQLIPNPNGEPLYQSVTIALDQLNCNK